MNANQKLCETKIYGRNITEFLLPDQIKFIEYAMEEYALEKNINLDDEFYYKKRDKILSFFYNSESYRTSSIFNKVVEMLIRDVDPFKIIEDLCIIIEDLNKKYIKKMSYGE